MALDFLNSLQIEEQPLMSLSEMNNSDESTNGSNSIENENGEETSTIPPKGNEDSLLPITSLVTKDDDKGPDNKAENVETNKQTTPATSSKKYAAIIKALHEKTGAFEEFNEEEFEDTPESFLEYLDMYATKNAENLANSYINSNLTPLQQKFVALVEDGLSEDNAAEIVKGYKLTENITEDVLIENPDKAKKLYAEYLRFTTSFSEDRIRKEINQKEESGSLITDALDIVPEFKDLLKEQEEEYKQELNGKVQQYQEFQQKQAQELKDYLDSTEEIGGIKLNKTLKAKWMQEYSLVDVRGKKVNPVLATREADPNKFDALLRLYHALGLFKYDNKKGQFNPDFSALKPNFKNETLTQLQKAVEFDNEKRRLSSFNSSDSIEFDVEKDEHKKRWQELSNKVKNLNL
jgi:hypothetical protein